MLHYAKPEIKSFTKEELNEKIIASASGCSYALCVVGTTFTCNASVPYTCIKYSSGTNPCPVGFGFTCTAAKKHTDAIGGDVTI